MTDLTAARAAALAAATRECECIVTQFLPFNGGPYTWSDGGKLNAAMLAEVNKTFDAKEGA